MNKITKEWCEKNIFIDRSVEPLLDYATACINAPVIIAVVQFELESSDGLIEMADEIRAREGHPPLSESGYYNFYLGINDFTKTHMDKAISISVCDEFADDDWEDYEIDLDESEQIAVYNRLNELCSKNGWPGCDALLSEARAEFID